MTNSRASAAVGALFGISRTSPVSSINSGCSLQSLIAMLGHVSAEMSLRHGRLIDATVRADYEKALTLAKERLGRVLPEATPVTLHTDWRHAPLIKARLAGGYCVRALAQGTCAYTNICEHCPNYGTVTTFLPTLLTQASRCEVTHGRRPSTRLEGRSRPPPPADQPARPARLGRPLSMSADPLTRVEAACAALAEAGTPVTFTAVAARVGIAKVTLYRRPELREVVP